MEGGVFDNPMDGLDLGELGSMGNPEANVSANAGGIPTEDEVKAEGDDSTPDLEPLEDDNKARDLHVGREIPAEEDLEGFEETGDVNIFQAFAEEGIIALGEDEEVPEEADLEWFAEKAKQKLQADLDAALEEYKEGLPDEAKYLLENYEQGVSIQDLLKADRKVMEIASIPTEKIEESESLQKDMLARYLKLSGETDEDIRDTLIDYEDSGLLEKMAKKAHGKLVQYEAAQKQQMVEREKQMSLQRKQEYNDWLTSMKSTIDAKEEIIPGIKITDKQRKELYKGITQVDKNGKNAVMKYREQNPDFDLQVAYLATVLKGDFSVFENIATTKATRNLKEQADGLSSTATKAGKRLKGVDLSIMKKALKL